MNGNLQHSGSGGIDLLLGPAIDDEQKRSNEFIVIDHRLPQWNGAVKEEVLSAKEQFTLSVKPNP